MLYDNKSVQEYVKNKKNELKENIKNIRNTRKNLNVVPCLAIVQVGDNPSSNSYIKGKLKDCEEVGIKTHLIKIEETEDTEAISNHLKLIVDELNRDDSVHGIIVQLPLPEGVCFNFNSICPQKDVDGFSRDSYFIPCTPLGVIKFLKNTNYDFKGKNVLVIGRSKTVGRPLAKMLTNLDATVTLAHSKTTFYHFQHDYDFVISCVNQPNLFKDLRTCGFFKTKDYRLANIFFNFKTESDETFVCCNNYIDIGLEKDENNKLCGNFNKEKHNALLEELKNSETDKELCCYAISGIGGVGLLTRLTLMENILSAYELQH